MGGMEVFLHFPGQPTGDLANDLTQQVVAAGLHQPLREHGDHFGELDPDRQVEVPAHACGGACIATLIASGWLLFEA